MADPVSINDWWPKWMFHCAPPPRPIEDDDEVALRTFARQCIEFADKVNNDNSEVDEHDPGAPPGPDEIEPTLLRAFHRILTKSPTLAWSRHHSHVALQTADETDLVYYKGDTIRILDSRGCWVLGDCRGRIGLAPLCHLRYDGFVRVRKTYVPACEESITIRMGETILIEDIAIPGFSAAFSDDHFGPIPNDCLLLPGVPLTDGYQYCKLEQGEIRLIRIDTAHVSSRKASGDESNFCSLITTCLEIAPVFTALSYCWGNANVDPREPVFCDGKVIMVPRNLANLLRDFPLENCVHNLLTNHKRRERRFVNAYDSRLYPKTRSLDTEQNDDPFNLKKTPLYLWADAICINQNDRAEKEIQIPRMRDIYSLASQVFVYLGEDADSMASYDFHMTLQGLAKYGEQFYQSSVALRDPAATLHFFTNPVFNRSWIVQEMILGRRVRFWYRPYLTDQDVIAAYCGEIGMLSDIVFHNRESGYHWPKFENEEDEGFNLAITDILAVREIREKSFEGTSLITLLDIFRNTRAQDPRDKVYSLLGICTNHYRSNITPDYGPDTSVACILKQLAHLTIANPDYQDVELLLLNAGIHDSETSSARGLPSWIPNLTVPASTSKLDHTLFSCSWRTQIDVRLPDSPDSSACSALHVTGALIDTLESLCHSQGPGRESTYATIANTVEANYDFLARVQAWASFSNLHIASGAPGDDSPSLIFDPTYFVLVCGYDFQGRAGPQHKARHTYQSYRRWEEEHTGATGSSRPLRKSGRHRDEQSFRPFFATVSAHMQGRRTGVTTNLSYGAFPNATVPGDVVAVLQGFNVPFVLRPVRPLKANGAKDEQFEPGCEKYRIIGTCYIHGIMDGELIGLEKQEGSSGAEATERVTVGGHPMRELVIV